MQNCRINIKERIWCCKFIVCKPYTLFNMVVGIVQSEIPVTVTEVPLGNVWIYWHNAWPYQAISIVTLDPFL